MVTLTQVNRDMKRLGITGPSGYTNMDKNTKKIVDKLIESGEILPYRKRIYRFVKPRRSKFGDYETFSKKEQDIIYHALQRENIEDRFNWYMYCFRTLKIYNLYPSVWHDAYDAYVNNGAYYRNVYQIYLLQKSIMRTGLRSDRPLLVMAGSYRVFGGNHRLQAIRNLVDSGKLGKNVQVPCIVSISVVSE